MKLRDYPLSELTVSLHYLRSTLACGKTTATVTGVARYPLRKKAKPCLKKKPSRMKKSQIVK